MKIAHVVCTFPPYKGGMGNSAFNYANYTTKYNHEITVFTPKYIYKKEGQFINTNPKLKIIRLLPVFSFGNAAVLPQLLWLLPKYDIVHLHYPFYGSAEIVALTKIFIPSTKLILHYHMDNECDGFKKLFFNISRHFSLPIIIRLADEITCASIDYVKHSNIGKYYKANPEKFVQIPFGVDADVFKPGQIEPDGIKRILFVGALDKQHYFKGVENLLKAFSKICETKKVRLIIVGKGDMESYYHKIAEDLKINDKVEFINNADDKELVKCYQRSNVLVLPSINQSEAFGLVLLEAMACGKPVIASNLPGVRSVFKNNEQGLIIKPDDIEDLAEKMNRIITNNRLAYRLGQEARKLIESKYTWDKAAEKLNVIYYRIKNTPKL
ncbi:MAG: glycosyltransferase family 4 protein [bacterium]